MSAMSPDSLSPVQQRALDRLLHILPTGSLFVVWGDEGLGKTTVLREARRRSGGVLLGMSDYIEALRNVQPAALEETFATLVSAALDEHPIVLVDDVHVLTKVMSCSPFYQRGQLIDGPLKVLANKAEASGRKLILAFDSAPTVVRARCHFAGMERFAVEDYAAICGAYLPEGQLAAVDLGKVFRFAPRLSGHQLRRASESLRDAGPLSTEGFIELLRTHHMVSNVDLNEVAPVELHDLKGIDDVIESLEANIVLPFENDALASELKLKPKRGVLLVGPPGTGKTTIGRALARRLRSKFLLIDGTFIAGTRNFYPRVQQVFEEAKSNAPAIIFIDDSDVIFDSEDNGLYRYLLTMLDGLESESAGRVCVMMTAMDVASLPPALVRSGRIELWLETRLPDLTGREEILREALAGVPAPLGGADARGLAEITEGLTGADLKGLVSGGKLLYANDRVRNRELRSATEYFAAAVDTVRQNRERYLRAEAALKEKRPARAFEVLPE